MKRERWRRHYPEVPLLLLLVSGPELLDSGIFFDSILLLHPSMTPPTQSTHDVMCCSRFFQPAVLLPANIPVTLEILYALPGTAWVTLE